jgi:hypothetical protein
VDRARGPAARGRAPLLEPQVLDPGAVARPVSPILATIGREGTATVAWSGISRSTHPVRVATARPTGRFGRAAQLAPNGEMLDVVTAGDGTTTVPWGPSTGPDVGILDGIFASRRAPAGSASAQPEAVTHDATLHAVIALDPRSGRPAVLWIAKPTGPLLTDDPGVLRYSTRGG